MISELDSNKSLQNLEELRLLHLHVYGKCFEFRDLGFYAFHLWLLKLAPCVAYGL